MGVQIHIITYQPNSSSWRSLHFLFWQPLLPVLMLMDTGMTITVMVDTATEAMVMTLAMEATARAMEVAMEAMAVMARAMEEATAMMATDMEARATEDMAMEDMAIEAMAIKQAFMM